MPDLTRNQGKVLHTLAVLADAYGPGKYHGPVYVGCEAGMSPETAAVSMHALYLLGYAERRRMPLNAERYRYRLTYEGTVLSNRVTASGDVRDA